jgi:hypothetical protein
VAETRPPGVQERRDQDNETLHVLFRVRLAVVVKSTPGAEILRANVRAGDPREVVNSGVYLPFYAARYAARGCNIELSPGRKYLSDHPRAA